MTLIQVDDAVLQMYSNGLSKAHAQERIAVFPGVARQSILCRNRLSGVRVIFQIASDKF